MEHRLRAMIFWALIALAAPSPAQAGPKEDAYIAVDQWAAAFNAGDVEKIVAAYTPDALVLGTISPSLASKPDDLRKYFGTSAAAKSQVKIGDFSTLVLSDGAVVFTGFYEFSRPRDGQTVVTPSRFTFVAVKRGDSWKLLHHHSSVRPKPPQ